MNHISEIFVHLNNMESGLHNLLFTLNQADQYKNERQPILQLCKKIRVIKALSEKPFLCVTGTQGAGKTRLMREFYGMDKELLEDNSGRGEKVPVFIIEKKGCDKPYAVSVQLKDQPDGTFAEQENPLSPEEFKKATKGENNHENSLFLRIYVKPSNEQGDSPIPFLLLPGYESIDASNKEWQEFMRYAVMHSRYSIFVTDQTRMAQNSQKQIMDDIKDIAKSIIVVSKTENKVTKSDDGQFKKQKGLEELCQTVAKYFQIPDSEKDIRIVCTGSSSDGDTSYRDYWKKGLIAAIDTYAKTSAETREIQLNVFDEIIKQFESIVDQIKDKGMMDNINNNLAEQTFSKMIEQFDKAVETYRKKYSKELKKFFDDYAEEKIANATKKYEDEEQGFLAGLNELVEAVTLQGDQAGNRLKEIIYQHWKGDEKSSPLTGNYQCISNASSESFSFLDKNKCDIQNNLLGYENEENVNKAIIAKFTTKENKNQLKEDLTLLQNDIQLLLGSKNFTKGDLTLKVEDTLKLLPALAMETQRFGLHIAYKHIDDYERRGFNHGQFIDQLRTDLPNVVQSGVDSATNIVGAIKSLRNTVGGLFAVDIAAEGAIAASGTAVATEGATTVATTGLGLGVATAAVGVVAIGYVGYKTVQAVNDGYIKDKDRIQYTINAFKENHVNKTLEHFDELMELLKERFEGNLRAAYGLDNRLSINDKLARQLARLHHIKIDFRNTLDQKSK